MERQRLAACLSDLRLDQLLSGELDAVLKRAAEAHCAECALCQGRHQQLRIDRENFATAVPPFEELMRRPRARQHVDATFRPRSRAPATRWLGYAGGLAAAAVLALVIGLEHRGQGPVHLPISGEVGGEAEPGEAGETRTKGSGVALGFVVRRGGQVFSGEAGQTLHPGDQLRFMLTSERAVYVGIWGIDAAGVVSAYHASGAELSKVPAGRRQPLSNAVELDDTLGEERLVAVFCTSKVRSAEVAAAIDAAPAAARLPEGCAREVLSIVKALP